MPKVADSSSEAVVKASRKRVSDRVAAPRKKKDLPSPRVSRITKVSRGEKIGENEKMRKAPTRFSTASDSRRHFSLKTAVRVVVPIIIISATVWIGFSDSGQIDVNAKINERNNHVANNEDGSEMVHVPVQNAPTIPNGGLVGQGVLETPTKLVPVSTGSTTDQIATTTVTEATSTDSGEESSSNDENVEEEADEETEETTPVIEGDPVPS
jgi:hypothetical protein